MIKLQHCKLADKAHENDLRSYAHTNHHKGTICVSDAIADLPYNYYIAIVLHEIGHIVSKIKTEDAANKAIFELTGIKIKYHDCPYGHDLEYITLEEAKQAHGFIDEVIA